MSSPFPVETKIAVFHRLVEASWKKHFGRSVLGVAATRGSPHEPFKHFPRAFHWVRGTKHTNAYFHESSSAAYLSESSFRRSVSSR